MKPIVSVIIPVYNADKVIGRCLRSLIEQTLQDIEIIVVDDGSTDETSRIVKDYAKEYKIISYIHQDNQGPGAARNTGLDNAIGQYIGFVDADDYIKSTMFETMYKKISQEDADCIVCNHETDIKKVDLFEKDILIISKETRAKGYIKYIAKYPVLWNKLYNKRCINNLKLDIKMKMGEDLLFNTKAYERMNKIVVLDEVLYHYSDEEKSITRTKKEVNYKNMIRSYCDDDLAKEVDQEVYQALVFVTGFLFSTVMNKKNLKYVYNEIKYLLDNKSIAIYKFIKSDVYYDITEVKTISKKIYYAYKLLFWIAYFKLVGVCSLGFWILAKLVRIGR